MNAARGIVGLLLLAASTAVGAENDDSAAPATEAAEPPVAEEDAEVEALTPRGRYNLGLTQLAGAEYEAAAETFLAARDDAGPDPELRYRAAFNLGLALAHGVAEDAPPAEAIDTLRRSAAWFNDAVRLAPPGDDDARINLELVSKRVLALADQLNEGATLQARLDRLIDDQRSIRDGIRSVLQDASPSGSARASQDADAPATENTRGITVALVEDHDAYNALASRERMLAADVGECIDLATEERLFIEQTPPDQLAPEQQGRAYQLRGVVDFLERARQSLSDARRRLRRLEGERAHRRADAALAELKRAREQLFDPLSVLQAAAQDQMRLATETAALATYRGEPERFEQAPGAWLTAKHLAERQEDVGARTGGVLGRFDAVTAASRENPDADSEALQAVAEATPIVEGGLAAMRNAIQALESDEPATALPEQTHALELLQQAIELFAGAKELIEFAFADQQHILALLTPGDGAAPSGAERTEALFARTTDNQRRLHRLGPLLEKEVQGAATDDEQADEQARQAAEERHRQAEALRERALDALDTLADRIADGPNSSAARTAADEGLAALAELRRLFFTLVEHIQALRRDQADTHDATATLQFDSTADAGDDLGTRIAANASRQTQHGQFGDAIAETLARQADAANTQAASAPDADGEQAAEANAEQAAERLAEAAEELRKAGGRMHSAAAILGDAATRARNMSPELEPALDDQLKALDHLDNALLAISPPDGEQENQNSEGEGQQEQEQQQAAQARQGSEEERMSQRQALKRLQAIRDREAQRQRRRGEAAAREPVEKDW